MNLANNTITNSAVTQPVITQNIQNITPPVVTQQTVTSPTTSFSFTESWTGSALLTVTTQPTANFTATSPGSGSVSPAGTSFFPNGFTVSNLLVQATLTTAGYNWNNGFTGTYNLTGSGSLSGPAGGNLTGTMNMNLILNTTDKNFVLKGPITYNPASGTMTMTFQYNSQQPTQNVFSSKGVTGWGSTPVGTVPTGTITQVKK